uniref:Cytochrome b n=1 Tax=Neomikiella lychnidis TaxID=2719079 RepID=A0A7L7S0H2_9DIPT|nr:cytochrome b [Neomikiella lychnidis]
MNKMNFLNFNNFMNNMKIPTPCNITLMWNFGSLLGICLMIQIMTGMILAFRYSPDINLAFNSINNIMNDSWMGFLLRNMHANGASVFFMLLYIHIGRGIYFKSFMFYKTWITGVILLLMIMGTAFLGYVLPWGQMSFWGSTVITNLISSIPYLGEYLVQWIWGGYSVNNPTLTRFFCLHFILPFMISVMMLIHLFFLHKSGSNNPLGIKSNNNKILFINFYIIKDLMGLMMLFIMMFFIITYYPYILSDSDNFILANSMVTPEHIQPEWYFLFAYAILRSIPKKLGGVIALLMSISILFFLPLFNMSNMNSNLYFFNKFMFWSLTNSVIMLTWIGVKPVEYPFIFIGQMLSIIYFFLYLVIPMIEKWFDKMIN